MKHISRRVVQLGQEASGSARLHWIHWHNKGRHITLAESFFGRCKMELNWIKHQLLKQCAASCNMLNYFQKCKSKRVGNQHPSIFRDWKTPDAQLQCSRYLFAWLSCVLEKYTVKINYLWNIYCTERLLGFLLALEFDIDVLDWNNADSNNLSDTDESGIMCIANIFCFLKVLRNIYKATLRLLNVLCCRKIWWLKTARVNYTGEKDAFFCLHLQSGFLYLCNCFSSQKHSHLSGYLKAQPCVGFALALCRASYLQGTEAHSWSIFISRSCITGIGQFCDATTWFWPQRIGERSIIQALVALFLLLCWIKTVSFGLLHHCCRTFLGCRTFLECFTFKLQSMHILKCVL